MGGPFAIGDPGRAPSRVVPVPDPAVPDRPDTVLDGFTLRGVRVRAASVRGLAHRCYGRTRQDDYAWRLTPDGRYLVLAVADGVSAGPHSHQAARIATGVGTDLVCQNPAYPHWPTVLHRVAVAVIQAARALGGAELDAAGAAELMATTVLYAVLDLVPDERGGHALELCSVGDTSAWLLSAEGRWWPHQPVKGAGEEVYSAAVRALPLADPLECTLVRDRLRPGQALFLMTDGVGDPLGDGTGEVGEVLAGLWREPPGELDFATQVGFARRSFDDDRTVLGVWPVSPPPASAGPGSAGPG
ncbi:serine/threonine protein phosphatase PrpC [Crossiella equi]|uniref:Serine/threonine protein phosphatase PrpC n=1 Tax=Crossiella equi TaxID=130796 RepID=A0ABS5APT7_9PSEU|nr:protein phosphatase 2C domain-containing protein [Crossiella equi]MBP2478446.1 serine/threonine protein phosphatase PrpC [Crossiella equi]